MDAGHDSAVRPHAACASPASMPLCEKREYIGAVTLTRFSPDGSLLYVGVGPTLFLYATSTGELVAQHDILTRGILHGCDIVERVATTTNSSDANKALTHVGVFFGQKRVACFHSLPQTPADAATQQTLTRIVIRSNSNSNNTRAPRATKVFSDWVFDVQILSSQSSQPSHAFPLVAVGLAHNVVQLWSPTSDTVLRTVQCAERCILYALAFHGRTFETLTVASGTVFQQILLWQPFASASDASASSESSQRDVVAPAQRLHGHDGVLFKLEWSRDATMLASVSDDRTVQLWSSRDAATFPRNGRADRTPTGWLETTVESIAFLAAIEDDARETEAPDVVDRLRTPFTSVFRSWGHTARLWDVAFCAYGLVTTSEDAVCKLWDLAGACIASLHGHAGRHVWRVAVHPTQAIVATGGSDSSVKLWHVANQLVSSSADADAFCSTIPLFPAAETTAKVTSKSQTKSQSVRDIVVNQRNGNDAFVASERGEIVRIDVSTQTSTPFVTLENRSDTSTTNNGGGMLSAFTSDANDRFLLAGDSSGTVTVVDMATGAVAFAWRAHATRIMKLVWPSVASDPSTLFTIGADCSICEWQPTLEESTITSIALVATYKSPGKCAASSLLVLDRNVTRNIVCGDGRGNVFVFRRLLLIADDAVAVVATEAQLPQLVLRNVHGREQVATLLLHPHDDVVYSGGHDGAICSLTTAFDATDGALTTLEFVGRDAIKGIATIKQLFVNDNGELFALGFFASDALLVNVRTQQRLFSVACGGWRRPHALVVKNVHHAASLPGHTLLFTPPVARKTDALELKVHSTIVALATRASALVPSPQSPVPLATSALHYQFHGKMTTCVVRIADRLVTAAEDNSVKLHVRHAQRFTSVSTGVAHTTTVRALTSFYVPQTAAHVLLTGGGKQRINVWRVRDAVDVIEHIGSAERADALQDHRILGLATFALQTDTTSSYRLVAACNSEGSIQLLVLNVVTGALRDLGDVRSSDKPILSCAGFQYRKPSSDDDEAPDTDAAILAVGSTDGLMTLWSFAGLVRELEQHVDDLEAVTSATVRRLLSYLVPVATYTAHDMGVNCVAIAAFDATTFTIVSGGDDQSVRLCKFATGGESYEVVSDARVVNASGSAIKAIWSNGSVLFFAGYDQRVSKWTIVEHDDDDVDAVTTTDKAAAVAVVKRRTTLTWQCAVFSECADIANLAVWTEQQGDSVDRAADGAFTVVAVGQGLQVMRFRA